MSDAVQLDLVDAVAFRAFEVRWRSLKESVGARAADLALELLVHERGRVTVEVRVNGRRWARCRSRLDLAGVADDIWAQRLVLLASRGARP